MPSRGKFRFHFLKKALKVDKCLSGPYVEIFEHLDLEFLWFKVHIFRQI